MKKRSLIAAMLLVGISLAQIGLTEEPHWRTRPGGLAAVDYEFATEPKTASQTGYHNIDFYFKVRTDPGDNIGAFGIPSSVRAEGVTNNIGYYWANQFGFVGSGNSMDGYMGIQTIGDIYKAGQTNRSDPASNQLIGQKRLAIFSIWNALDARPVGKGSYAAPYGHEGKGWSCKVAYPWRAGVTYRLRIFELSDARKPNEPEWWRGSIMDMSTRQDRPIGDIKVPANWGWLHRRASMFTEYYSQIVKQSIGDADDGKPNPRVCDYMPKAAIDILPPTADSGKFTVRQMTPKNYGKCAGVSMFCKLNGNRLGEAIRSGTTIQPQTIVNFTGKLDPKGR